VTRVTPAIQKYAGCDAARLQARTMEVRLRSFAAGMRGATVDWPLMVGALAAPASLPAAGAAAAAAAAAASAAAAAAAV